MTANAQTPWK